MIWNLFTDIDKAANLSVVDLQLIFLRLRYAFFSRSAAWAAARRATGTRKGEHDT